MVGRFLSYVEIKTKVTSVFAFALTLAYLFSVHAKIDFLRSGIFFAAMFIFDLTTTAINNYMDTKKNNQPLQFKRSAALIIIYVMFIAGAVLGICLAVLTDPVVLLLGVLCFVCGVLYSWGPVPISHQVWGEFFSGLFYGLLIPFLLLYINMPAGTYLSYDLTPKTLRVSIEVMPIVTVLLLSAAPFCTTANIMLANNICDTEKDIGVKRYTLPYYLGVKNSLQLFAALYYLIFFAVIAMVALNMLHPVCLMTLLAVIPVTKNIVTFFKKQDKAETFIVSVKNYVIIMAALSLTVLISGFLK